MTVTQIKPSGEKDRIIEGRILCSELRILLSLRKSHIKKDRLKRGAMCHFLILSFGKDQGSISFVDVWGIQHMIGASITSDTVSEKQMTLRVSAFDAYLFCRAANLVLKEGVGGINLRLDVDTQVLTLCVSDTICVTLLIDSLSMP